MLLPNAPVGAWVMVVKEDALPEVGQIIGCQGGVIHYVAPHRGGWVSGTASIRELQVLDQMGLEGPLYAFDLRLA